MRNEVNSTPTLESTALQPHRHSDQRRVSGYGLAPVATHGLLLPARDAYAM